MEKKDYIEEVILQKIANPKVQSNYHDRINILD
jgi:hypothetical protein